jgi:hypothetical protein
MDPERYLAEQAGPAGDVRVQDDAYRARLGALRQLIATTWGKI